jgi:hypothetical protein
LAVTTTASVVSTGYSSHSHRHRLRAVMMIATATSSAHPTCTDGIAASWAGSSFRPGA